MTGLRASHARTCAHAFAHFRAAEAVPSLLSSLLDLSGLIQGFAREKGLFRGLFRLCRFFFIFFNSTIPQKFQERTARTSSLSAPHTSHQARTPRASSVAAGPAPSHASTPSSPPLSPLSRASCPFVHKRFFYYSTLHSCLCSPCPTRACLVAV